MRCWEWRRERASGGGSSTVIGSVGSQGPCRVPLYGLAQPVLPGTLSVLPCEILLLCERIAAGDGIAECRPKQKIGREVRQILRPVFMQLCNDRFLPYLLIKDKYQSVQTVDWPRKGSNAVETFELVEITGIPETLLGEKEYLRLRS